MCRALRSLGPSFRWERDGTYDLVFGLLRPGFQSFGLKPGLILECTASPVEGAGFQRGGVVEIAVPGIGFQAGEAAGQGFDRVVVA